ncbi:hypothetical protein K458DRAFT_398294 [Lentithecium fluviatile CBS 122367]|uniref:Uncharacterized protein n=1 Tax=Lentithecium fluviatile CBS 122367 TaxID=1168545 RepID=A0A6G1JNA4_9PLEO|nr:hypothetical protein K458DRAFT_398294 [Lentithecium fluviatile CBS 122367]
MTFQRSFEISSVCGHSNGQSETILQQHAPEAEIPSMDAFSGHLSSTSSTNHVQSETSQQHAPEAEVPSMDAPSEQRLPFDSTELMLRVVASIQGPLPDPSSALSLTGLKMASLLVVTSLHRLYTFSLATIMYPGSTVPNINEAIYNTIKAKDSNKPQPPRGVGPFTREWLGLCRNRYPFFFRTPA